MRKALVAALAAALLSISPVVAKNHHARHHASAPAHPAVHPAMFTVHGSKGTVYLFGSVHVLPPNVNWKYPALMAAMQRSDTFVFEVPLDHWDQDVKTAQTVQKEIMDAHGMLPPGESLRHQLPADMVPKYDAVIATLGISPGYIDRLQPWLAAMVLETAGFFQSDARAMNGVDVNVYAMAQDMHKQTQGLETLEDQLKMISSQEQMYGMDQLDHTITAMSGDPKAANFDSIFAAWERGDVDAIARLSEHELGRHPDIQKALLQDRNTRWVGELEAMLAEPHVYFVTVGAAHLAGPEGVPAQLRAAGYKVDGPTELRASPTPSLDRLIRKLAPK